MTAPVSTPDSDARADRRRAGPLWWVNSTYFAEGFPYALVNNVAEVLFKKLGASLEAIGLTSVFHLAWNLKLLWAPVLDHYETKRRFLLACEWIVIALVLVLAVLGTGIPLWAASVVFVALALVAATHDVAIDGYYLEALDQDEQAKYVGLRAGAYRVAVLAATGPLLVLAGAYGWHVAWFAALAVMLGVVAFHRRYLPEPQVRRAKLWGLLKRALAPPTLATAATPGRRLGAAYAAAFRQFLDHPRIRWAIALVITFRLGESFLMKMRMPFLLDECQLTLEDYGWINGTLGMLATIGGTLLGGWLIGKYGLRRALWPLVAAQNLPNLLYVGLATNEPASLGVWIPGAVVIVEDIGAGMGTAAFMVYLMRTCDPRHKATHMAIVTAIMSIGFTLAGMSSGFAVGWMGGYTNYFLFAFIATIPSMLILPFAPFIDVSRAEAYEALHPDEAAGGPAAPG